MFYPYTPNDEDPRNTVMFFTYRSLKELVDEGATMSWRLKPERAASCEYGLCVRSTVPHAAKDFQPYTAFILFRNKGVAHTREKMDPLERPRYEVQFDEYAEIKLATEWGDRNPVHYAALEELEFFAPDGSGKRVKLDPNKLVWKRIPNANVRHSEPNEFAPEPEQPEKDPNSFPKHQAKMLADEIRKCHTELDEAAKLLSGCGLKGVAKIYEEAAKRAMETLMNTDYV